MWKRNLKALLNFLALSTLLWFQRTQAQNSKTPDLDWDWMQTGTVGIVQGGVWLRPYLCPEGSFVTEYGIKYGAGNKKGEITGLTLGCSKLDEKYNLVNVEYLDANGVRVAKEKSDDFRSANWYAVGFFMARWTDSAGFEYVDGRKLTFYREDESKKSRFRFPKSAVASRVVSVGCPEGWAICGVQGGQLNGEDDDHDDDVGILTQFRFKCCYYCLPQESREILDDFTNPGSTNYVRTIQNTVGTQIDLVKGNRGTTGGGRDRIKESQVSNSKILGTAEKNSEGDTSGTSTSNTEGSGIGTEAQLRISTSSANTQNVQRTNATSREEFESQSTAKSKTKVENSFYNKTDGTSSRHAFSVGFELGASVGATVDVVEAKAEQKLTLGYDYEKNYKEEVIMGTNNVTTDNMSENRTVSIQEGSMNSTTTGNSTTNESGLENTRKAVESATSSSSSEKQRQKSIERAKEQSIQEGAESMFKSRQGASESWQFEWNQSQNSLWKTERVDTYVFTCEPLQRCKIVQVYGTCGALRIGTTRIVKELETIKNGESGGSPKFESATGNSSNSSGPIQWKINIPGEKWIVAKDVSNWEPSGQWENVQLCPPDKIVTGHSLRYLSRAGVSGIALICSDKYGPDEGQLEHQNATILRLGLGDRISEEGKHQSRGNWGTVYRGTRAFFATGFSFVSQEWNGQRFVGNHEMIYESIKPKKIPHHLAVNSRIVATKCPEDHAICGVTAMMDKSGVGILTALGFRCCPHCIPQEKWVAVQQYKNDGPSAEKREVRTTVGLKRTRTNTDSSSSKLGNTIDSDGLQAGFSARFGTSNSTGFDWTHTAASVWNEEKTVTEFYTCEPHSFCLYERLEGQCGTARVPVDKFHKKSTLLPGYAPPPPTTDDKHQLPNYLKLLQNEDTPVLEPNEGEIWIEALNIQHENEENMNKNWLPSESCPPGSFATGYKIQKYISTGEEDKDLDDLIKGIALQCSKWDDQGNFQPVKLIYGDGRQFGRSNSDLKLDQSEDWSNLIQDQRDSSPFSSPAIGFLYFQHIWLDNEGQPFGEDFKEHSLVFQSSRFNILKTHVFDDYQMKVVPIKILCPTQYVLCGVRTRKNDMGILTDVRFQCCYHCEPKEMEDEVDYQENPTEVTMTHKVPSVTVGAKVVVKNPLKLASTSTSMETNHNKRFTLHPGFSDYNYIRQMFADRLPKKLTPTPTSGTSVAESTARSRSKIEWKRQRIDLWTKEVTVEVVNSCKPQHACVVNQLIGMCGEFRIPATVLPTQYTPLSD